MESNLPPSHPLPSSFTSAPAARPSVRSRTTPTGAEKDTLLAPSPRTTNKPFLSQYLRYVRSAIGYAASHPKRVAAAAVAAAAGIVVLVVIVSWLRGGGGGGGGLVVRGGGTFASGGNGNWGLSMCMAKGEKIRPFVYMYDFGKDYTEGIRSKTPNWYSDVYDAEKLFYEYVQGTSAVRTWNPEKATLFYIPFFSSYFLSCQYRDGDGNMREAVTKTSEVWEAVIKRVRRDFPYFNRTNGRDHFSVLSMDHGRCQSLTYVDPAVVADMFFIVHAGDKMLRSTHTHAKRGMQVLSYNYGQPTAPDIPDIPCYRPELDIVVPPSLEESSKQLMGVTSPFVGERSITVLFRFRPNRYHMQPVLHSNHDIRKELYDLYENKGYEGWEFGIREPEKIFREDMQRSVFCVCPPGHSQWTSRTTKAILAGCIPVTFFRDNDNPWQNELDHTVFTVNIDPTELHTLSERLDAILRNPRRLLRMQRNLERVQRYFTWDATLPTGGVQQHITERLWCTAKYLDAGAAGRQRREARGGPRMSPPDTSTLKRGVLGLKKRKRGVTG